MSDEVKDTLENEEPNAGELQNEQVETDVMTDISNFLQNPQTEEAQPEEDAGSEAETEEVKSEPVIDDSWIDEYSALKPLKGKPIKELGKSYAELQKQFTKLSQENATLRKQGEQSVQKQVQDKLEEESIDIAALEPKEQREVLTRMIREIAAEATRPYQEVYQKEQEKVFVTDLQQNVEKAVEQIVGKENSGAYAAEKMLDEWRTANAEYLYNADGTLKEDVNAYYSRNPHRLIADVVLFAKGKALEDSHNALKKGVKLEAYKQTVSTMRKANEEPSKVKSAAQKREVPQLTKDDALWKDIGDFVDSRG